MNFPQMTCLLMALSVVVSCQRPAQAVEEPRSEITMLTSVLGRGFGVALKATSRFRLVKAEDQVAKAAQKAIFVLIAAVDGQPLKAPQEMRCDFFSAHVRDQILAPDFAAGAETAVIGYETVIMKGLPIGIEKYLKPSESNMPAMEGWHAIPTFVVVALAK